MRTLRLLVAFAAMGSVVAAAACSSSSDNGGGGGGEADSGVGTGPDGSTSGTDGSTTGNDGSTKVDAETPPTITPAANDLKVYLGQIAQLDASGTTVSPSSATVTYKWTVESAPAGSTVTTPSLFNAGSAKPSFTPDVLGDYKVKVTITAGTATADKTVTVSAYEAQAMFFYTDGDGGVTKSGVRAVPTMSDGGATNLSCHFWDGGGYDLLAGIYTAIAADMWEGAPGSASEAAYLQQDKKSDGGQSYTLNFVTTASTCGAPPTALDHFESTNDLILEPRISPNGGRVAYVRKPASPVGDRIATVGTDGMNRHIVAPLLARPDGGPFPDASAPTGQQANGSIVGLRWLDDAKIGWLQFTSGGGWQIVVANDADDATADVFMTCSSIAPSDRPNQFAFLPDGSVLVVQRSAFGDAGKMGARDLLVFKPNDTTKKCELVRNLSNLESDGGAQVSAANNFSVSPDGQQVAYVLVDAIHDAGGRTPNSVWVAATNGLTPPAPLPGAPDNGAILNVGPRWAAGGALLVWPQEQRSVPEAGAGTSQAIVVAPSGGGSMHVLANSKSQYTNVYAIGNGAACTIATASGSGLVGLGALGAFVGLLARRRRRS